MGKIQAFIDGLFAARAARKSRCVECNRPLQRNAVDRFCSDVCAIEVKVHGSY
jgi:hypothetical protein